MLRLAVTMLVTTAAFIVVAHPPVAVADLLVAANTGTGQPEHCANEDALDCAMRKELWQVKLRKLVQNGVTYPHNHHHQP